MKKEILQKIKNITVLYVEDEENIRQKIADTLRYYVKEVIVASDGLEGLCKYRECKPDIILSDVKMPNMDGISMVKEIRKHDTKTPISLITAHTDKEMLLDAVKLHLEEYLIKPVTFDDIIKVLSTTSTPVEKTYKLSSNMEYDKINRAIIQDKKQIKLTKKESIFFELLINHEDKILSYEQLQADVWGDEVMTDNALRSLVHSLRQKIGKDSIKNLSGFGYRLDLS